MDPTDTVVPDCEYDAFMMQLSRLTPRKQARWYKVLHGRTENTILRFKNGALVDCTPRGDQPVKRMSECSPNDPAAVYESDAARLWARMILHLASTQD
jgi:hypothetical protein